MKTMRQEIKKRINEVFLVEPNDLGFAVLTSNYKRLTSHLKTMPFILIVPFSIVFASLLYLIFDYLFVRLATILQYGF